MATTKIETPAIEVARLDHVLLRYTRLEKTLDSYRTVMKCGLEPLTEDIRLWHLHASSTLMDIFPIGTQLSGTTALFVPMSLALIFRRTLDRYDHVLLTCTQHGTSGRP